MLYIVVFCLCYGWFDLPWSDPLTLKWWSKKTPSNYRLIEYRLNLSHNCSVHSHCLLFFNSKQSIKTFLTHSKCKKWPAIPQRLYTSGILRGQSSGRILTPKSLIYTTYTFVWLLNLYINIFTVNVDKILSKIFTLTPHP